MDGSPFDEFVTLRMPAQGAFKPGSRGSSSRIISRFSPPSARV